MVSCSDLIPLKRVNLIIGALALLPKSIHIKWSHIGDGAEQAQLEAYAEKTLPPHVCWKFWGHVPNNRIDELYQSLKPDLFLTATSTEGGVPVSIQEAFSAGIPAIATSAGGIPEIVLDGETGFLLPENPSVQELADAILRFYKLPAAKKAAMGAAARALWENRFDAEKNAESFVSLLKHIL